MDTVAALRSSSRTGLVEGDVVAVVGYYSPGDGAGLRHYRLQKNANLADNGGTTIMPTGAATPGDRWELIHGGEINARWFGARGNWASVSNPGADDTSALQTAIDVHLADGVPLLIPRGDHRTTTTLRATGKPAIRGAGAQATRIRPDSGTGYDALTLGPGSTGSGSEPGGYLRDLGVEEPSSLPAGFRAGVKLDGLRQAEVKNITAVRFGTGFDFVNNCFGSYLDNCRSWGGAQQAGMEH